VRRSTVSWGAVLLTMVAVTGACGGSTTSARRTPSSTAAGKTSSTAHAPAANPNACGLARLRAAHKPVEITMWYEFPPGGRTEIEKLAAEFNSSQHDVHVRLVDQVTYEDMLPKYRAGLQTGDLPDLVQGDNMTLQTIVDSRHIVPVEACVKADHYDLADFLPRAIAAYRVGNTLQALPWNVSNPILIFDATLFRKAGLDPAKPPTTLAGIKAASQQIVDRGVAKHGIALPRKAYLIEHMLAKSDVLFVDHGNGRTGRAARSLLDGAVGREAFTWWDDMVRSGLALDTGTDQSAHLLALGNGNAAMTIEGSGVLGPIRGVLESGQYKGAQIAAGPMPSPRSGGGVSVGDGALFLVNTKPERVAAAWKFARFLEEPHNVARIAAAGGYVPVRRSAVDDEVLASTWRAYPSFRVAYDQLLAGPNDSATAGPVIGDYQGVRNEVVNALAAMLTGRASPTEAVKQAARGATARLQEYNGRL